MKEIPINQEHLGVIPLQKISLNNMDVYVTYGSIVDFEGDCVVNATNEQGLGGGGVDEAVNIVGGQVIVEAREKLPVVNQEYVVRIPTGKAEITVSGDLPSRYCIHAVGPAFWAKYLSNKEQLLKEAYKNSLNIVYGDKEKNIISVAFSLLSSGVFRGEKTLHEVLCLGLEAIREYDTSRCGLIGERRQVYVVAYTPEEKAALEAAASQVFPRA
eukprot:maker-scaffold_49-snap-gene-1.89-mRNA-1 protein AED:0.21 eAED:0.21 QI:170/1/1/1/1/1/2/548/213